MKLRLTERERLALGTVIECLDQKDEHDEVGVDLSWFARHMRYVKPIHNKVSQENRYKHAKTVLWILSLKLQAMGINFSRVSGLGRGVVGEYNFGSVDDFAKAKKLYREATA